MYSGYYYPNTEVLKNKYGITNKRELNRQCSRETKKIMIALRQEPSPEEFDSSYLKYLHQRLFESTFEWAGCIRGRTFKFADGTAAKQYIVKTEDLQDSFLTGYKIEKSFQEFDKMLSEKDYLRGLSREEFVNEATKLFSFLNYIHPFKDGNRRAQQIFFEKLAEAAGHKLDFSVVTRKRMIHACSQAMPKNANYEAMRHLFEDISNPEKVYLLQEAIYTQSGKKRKNLDDKIVVIAHEDVAYTGIYRNSEFNSIMIDTVDSYILCCKDYFTPEQLKALKPNDELNFTAPINKNLNQFLIPAEQLPPLKEEEVIEKIENNACIQESLQKIRELSKSVYDNPKILEQDISRININPKISIELSERIINSAKSIGRLKGSKIGRIKSQTYKTSERNSKMLGNEISNYGDKVSNIRCTIIRKHRAKERRLLQTVKMPSKKLQDILNLSVNLQLHALRSSPETYIEMNDFIRQITVRLSKKEHQKMCNSNYKELSESIGISVNKAKMVIETVNKVNKILNILQPKNPQMQFMTL
ncbi:BID domain-containing T4SS effector [Bartonella sp. 1-1C]|uniref:BID domain-containing T4SS effector n=1 Tax=Bartonella sp. 1-1C TaxID=515256 RepID=UPI0001F4C3F6|nr:BID domain-containing T4SS effector [Bartonella sp. 1-1C]ATO57484.1 Bartonella effector protein Bep6 [Bartonella sp. 1-1C]CBI80766.1 Bartonella effector protein (Bep); substrate of VirB T4SS [Bartonella sp. 1-1C]